LDANAPGGRRRQLCRSAAAAQRCHGHRANQRCRCLGGQTSLDGKRLTGVWALTA